MSAVSEDSPNATPGSEGSAKTEREIFKGILVGLTALAYFTGFVVRFDFLGRLGLSIASTTLPVYYLCVYGFDVVLRELWIVPSILGIGSLAGWAGWQMGGRPREAEKFLLWGLYPGLLGAFVLAFPILTYAAQLAADQQVDDLLGPRHELGTTVVLAKRYLLDHQSDPNLKRLMAAAADSRLLLVAESAQDLIFFERPRPHARDLAPATRVYRLRKADVALAATRIGP